MTNKELIKQLKECPEDYNIEVDSDHCDLPKNLNIEVNHLDGIITIIQGNSGVIIGDGDDR